jgi:putative PEP-CTERM system TPR-repeat lipoprotein
MNVVDKPSRTLLRGVILLAALLVGACGIAVDNAARLQRGQEAYENGEYPAAVIDAKRVLQDEPRNAAARLLLGRASLEIGDAATAEAELRRALELGVRSADLRLDLARALVLQRQFDDALSVLDAEPFRDLEYTAMTWRVRGSALLGSGRIDEAREAFSLALLENPGDRSATLGIVDTYVREGNLLQARQTLDQFIAADPDYLPALIASGQLAIESRDYDRAERDFARAAEVARSAADTDAEVAALFGLADAMLSPDELAEVQSVLLRMQEIAPNDVRTLIISAWAAAGQGQWMDAQRPLQEILKRYPDHRPAQVLLGHAHKEVGNLEQAEMYLSAAVAATPDNSVARRLLAETRLLLNKTLEAQRVLEPLVSGANPDAGALSLEASIRLQAGNSEGAVELLRRGIAENPSATDLQLQLAFTYFRSGQNRQALAVLEEMPGPDSSQAPLKESLTVLALLADGRANESLQAAETVVARVPDKAESHLLLGFVQAFAGDQDAARESFQYAARLEPESPSPLWFLAQLDESQGRLEAAQDRYKAVLERRPDDVRAMIGIAQAAARAEDLDTSIHWLERAIATDSEAVDPRKALGRVLLSQQEYADAETVLSDLPSAADNDPELLNLRGLAELGQLNTRGAAASFAQALELDPENAKYRLNLAKAQAAGGNRLAAVATLQGSDESYLQDLSSGLTVSVLKAELGQEAEALSIAQRLKSIHPESAAPHLIEAELLNRQGETKAAIAAYERSLDLELSAPVAARAFELRVQSGMPDPLTPIQRYLDARPLDADMRVYLAQVYAAQGNVAGTIEEYEKALESAPDNHIAANNLAWSYWQQKNPRAEAMARRAYEIAPDNSSVLDTLGWILETKGDHTEAISFLRRAAESEEAGSTVHFHLATALANAGRTQEAKQVLTALLRRNQDFNGREDAERLLATL